MPVITPRKTLPSYDVIVVGSGAAGGISAYVLAEAGLKVLVLEAGRDYVPEKETPMFQGPADAPLRGAATPDKPFGFFDATVDGGWTVPGEPYRVRRREAPDWHDARDWKARETSQNFIWWRSRMLGGRTNHWGRISLRMGEYDFKPKSRDGLGLDWPMTYADLEPWYDKTEALIGVYGGNEGLENTPVSRNGTLQPPPPPRAYERLTQRACARLGIPVIPSNLAILTRPLRGRAACFWATDCGRGCSIRANFQSTTVLLPPAVATGNLDIITEAMVFNVTLNARGRADGVLYIDKRSGREEKATARVVILAASGCESARILLNSRPAGHPDGLGNSSGKIGRYLMDTVGSSLSGQIPALENLPPHNEDGASAMHVYMPWWLYGEQKAGRLDFARGYHIEFHGGKRMPNLGVYTPSGTSFGGALREEARRYYGSILNFSGRGEMIPNEDCYCELDPERKDAWGIPVLRFHWKWSDHEKRQAVHMQRTFAQIIETLGGKPLTAPQLDPEKAIMAGGSIIHEVGTTCMGEDRKTSVLNQYCQSWDVPNLFVTDGGPFVSNADKNPTLSIMAIAMRSCTWLAEEMRRGNIG
jgi:choline dehydrogenase-like flavoprotein